MNTFIEKNTRTLRKIFPILENMIVNPEPVSINYVELAITTKCTLCCKNCWHLMPYYLFHPVGLKKQGHFQSSQLIKVIDNFLASVDVVENFCLLGGEPFLYPDLSKIINKLINESKIKKIGIITNGTLIPSDETLKSLLHDKVYFDISDYGEISRKKEELIELFDKNNIPYNLRNCYEEKWLDPGIPDFRGRTDTELEEIYSKCTVPLCQFILDGKFYMCPRAAHEANLELHPEFKEEFVDLMQNNAKKRKEKLKKLLNRKFIPSCNYCNGLQVENKIPAAVQLTVENIKKLKKQAEEKM